MQEELHKLCPPKLSSTTTVSPARAVGAPDSLWGRSTGVRTVRLNHGCTSRASIEAFSPCRPLFCVRQVCALLLLQRVTRDFMGDHDSAQHKKSASVSGAVSLGAAPSLSIVRVAPSFWIRATRNIRTTEPSCWWKEMPFLVQNPRQETLGCLPFNIIRTTGERWRWRGCPGADKL